MTTLRPLARTLPALAAFALLTALPALAASKGEEVVKPIKTLVQAVRLAKDDLALKNFAADAQGKFIFGDAEWAKAPEEKRKEFTSLFQTIFSKLAFPKIRKNFEHLESITYGEPKVTGDTAEVGGVVVVLHPAAKQEYKLRYTTAKEKAGWKVVDVQVMGVKADSLLSSAKKEAASLYEKGGWDLLLTKMREKAKELEGQK